MRSEYGIRKASRDDLEALIAFTLGEAREAEGVELDADDVTRGVRTGLEDPSVATYWVAETKDGEVVASTSVVTELSDWRGGHYWWIQSLFIAPEHRGRGLVELLVAEVDQAAQAAGALELRLYAHGSNRRALNAYRRLGFRASPYTIMTRELGGKVSPDGDR
jgi:ribosomal protein S18 acetylase RimI-like enzyme